MFLTHQIVKIIKVTTWSVFIYFSEFNKISVVLFVVRFLLVWLNWWFIFIIIVKKLSPLFYRVKKTR